MDSTCDAMTSTGVVYAARVPGSWPERAAAAGSPAPLKSTGDGPAAAAEWLLSYKGEVPYS